MRPPTFAQGPLTSQPAIRTALDFIRVNEPEVLNEQVRLCEVPAPPFAEQQRAQAYRAAFERLGLENVRIDAIGNVLGERPGRTQGPRIVVSAHLDTVFPEGTNVKTTRTGSVIAGPGIGDDCRGLAVVLGLIRALNEARIETTGPVTFVGTVGEEGLGDLRGVKHLVTTELKGRIDRFVSIDGTGLSITHVGVGSRRYRVAFKGPGGHSFGDFGIANPVHALGRAIAKIAALQVPREPKTTFNVGRIGGGTSINSIAAEAWMEIDMRWADRPALADIDRRIVEALDQALAEENGRWGDKGRLTLEKTLVGDRPAGSTPASDAIVRAALDVSRQLEVNAPLEEGSTDANYPMSVGIPAITIDGGGRGEGAHSLAERFDTTDSWKGTARAFLLTVALAR
jgi:acetylornithine deacetylase/succinyl-diaminopimelate desuccinylase-like protein